MSAEADLAGFFLLEFGIVCGENTAGEGGEGVPEDRKAAPALRARSLRSYVPLRLRPERKCVLRHSLPSSRRKFSLRTNLNFNQFCPKISLFRLYILSPPENMIKIVQNSGALYTRPVIVSS